MKSKLSNILFLSLFLAFFISACTTRLDLMSPANTDLSGTWILDESASQTVRISAARSNNNARGMGGMSGMGGGENESADAPQGGGEFGGSPRLTPAMKAAEMTIEQNHDSMGIAYPNELYRDIDWGEKKFYRETVSAGWQKELLIVISASDQMTLTETYQLNPSRDVLTLTLSIKDQRGTNEFVRVFNLQNHTIN